MIPQNHPSQLLLDDITNENVCKKITICGSIKYRSLIDQYEAYYSLLGNLIYTPINYASIKSLYKTKDEFIRNKEMMKKCHFSKINESDAIIIINKDFYIGKDTETELIYAHLQGIPIILINVNEEYPYFKNNDKNYPLYIYYDEDEEE